VRSLLGWSALGLAGRIRADAAPLGDLAAEEFMMFVSYLSSGLALPISPFFLLLLEEFGLQLQHLTPHSILQAAIFVHLCGMFVGVAPCTSLFCHFFVLVKSGKARDHLGAYYFQTRPNSTVDYISTFGGARWENWRGDWVIASAEANDCLVLPSNGPTLDHKHWKTKPSLVLEFLPVLDRIKTLATDGLTSMHMVRLPEAPDHAAAEEGVPVLLVHRPKQHRPDPARAGNRPVLGGVGTPGEGDYW
jgi:hypothetical protein